MGVFRHRCRQEAHLRSQHPATDSDDENAGAESEVCLDTLRDKPSRAQRREDRHQDNPARVGQRDEDPEDERIDGTTARTDNVRSRDRLPVPRGRRVYRAQPKAGEEVEGAFSHSLAPREQGGKASWLPPLKGAGSALSRLTATQTLLGADVRPGSQGPKSSHWLKDRFSHVIPVVKPWLKDGGD